MTEKHDTMRAAFEAAWRAEYPLHDDNVFRRSLIDGSCYAGTRVQDGWRMWQAARASSLERASGPVKAYCRVCADVTPCEWRWNSDTCADLCCTQCHEIHVCIHEFSDCDSQRLGSLARAVMHDQTYHDTLAERVASLEASLATARADGYRAGLKRAAQIATSWDDGIEVTHEVADAIRAEIGKEGM